MLATLTIDYHWAEIGAGIIILYFTFNALPVGLLSHFNKFHRLPIHLATHLLFTRIHSLTHPPRQRTLHHTQIYHYLPPPPTSLHLLSLTMASPIPTTFATDSSPQESFAAHYDLDNPIESVNSYSR